MEARSDLKNLYFQVMEQVLGVRGHGRDIQENRALFCFHVVCGRMSLAWSRS
jgi:hypothetical protein